MSQPLSKWDTISYPLFVHATRKDTYGWVLYHMRPKAECDTAPIHRYFPYCVRTNRGKQIYHLVDMNNYDKKRKKKKKTYFVHKWNGRQLFNYKLTKYILQYNQAICLNSYFPYYCNQPGNMGPRHANLWKYKPVFWSPQTCIFQQKPVFFKNIHKQASFTLIL